MKPALANGLSIYLFIVFCTLARAQDNFDLEDYKQYLELNKDLTTEQLSGRFQLNHSYRAQIDFDPTAAAYLDNIKIKYDLTLDELATIREYGFMVTERVNLQSFGMTFLDIYVKDLPIFISTDAILFALHMSYDAILQEIEISTLIQKLQTALQSMHEYWPTLNLEFNQIAGMLPSLQDLDVYLTVARSLLEGGVVSTKGENNDIVDELLQLITAEQPAWYPLFNETERLLDFSQYKPRGHYTDSKRLENYFKAMIWLGRTEFRLTPPVEPGGPPPPDVTREIVDAYLVRLCAEQSGAIQLLAEIDQIIQFMVGESDNVTLEHLQLLAGEIDLTSPAQLLAPQVKQKFQQALADKSFALQRINSQILFSNPMNPEQIKPPSAFLLFGQRFMVDSFIMSNVVYDKIIFQDRKIWRDLPSSLDALFVLGNNAALPLLKAELDEFKYAANLNALRFLIDSYKTDFWQSSLTNVWLNAIRQLNMQSQFELLPQFMQTGAWQQEKMNTQLAAWAELRHDNFLYAKQSYTGGAVCSYPFSFLEPYPQFYATIKLFAEKAHSFFTTQTFTDDAAKYHLLSFFQNMAATLDTLTEIAAKELQRIPFTQQETDFLKGMLYDQRVNCVPVYAGWYPRLFYFSQQDVENIDFLVADVHTAPTDEVGNLIGKILHVGTGCVNLGVFVVENADGGSRAYVGPVMSYHEHVTLNFERLTDLDWQKLFYQNPPSRPDWINLYLIGKSGRKRPSGRILVTSVDNDQPDQPLPETTLLRQNYPNPFNAGTVISFDVPYLKGGGNEKVALAIYNLQGRLVKTLVDERLAPGTYLLRWDGNQDNGLAVASGIYFLQLKIGVQVNLQKMTILR